MGNKRATQCLVCAVSDTAAHITRLEADVARLTKERDELERTRELMARDWCDFCEVMGVTFDTQEAVACELHARAQTSEAQNKAMRDLVEQAFRDGLAYGSNVSNGNEPGIASIAWAGSRARATLSSIKEGGGKPS